MRIFDRTPAKPEVVAPKTIEAEVAVVESVTAGLKADINPGKGASVSRRINRHASCVAGILSAQKRGDRRKERQLDRERMALEGSLLEEKAEIEQLIKQAALIK